MARDYGISVDQVLKIARRQRWNHKAYEPDGEWWREKELREMSEARERRRLERER